MDKYSWSFNGDAEHWYEGADTIEDCIAQAKEQIAKDDDIQFVYIGENIAFTPTVDAGLVLERIEEEAYEFCELAEDWEAVNYKEQEELFELSDQLTAIVQDWLKKNNREPYFYSVENIKEYSLG